MNVPENLRYTSDHEWILLEGDVATVGITDHAQEELTDVVFVELPDDGRSCDAGDPVAVVESVKAASDIYCPIAGEIVSGNTDLEADPSLVNTDPYGAGWIFKVRVKDVADVEAQMDADGYKGLIG
ncbi:glycine cleavage system H protein [Oceaniferula spumae]|uniref:Glycine cleavage system H protein n=1 Tax=Oceaniferula spumae TaxID=2979115 RepID=A0AAT9FIB3_9BACT